jgi:FADH2 O2-dependent halogenase
MMRQSAEIAILGAGFAGTLIAMLLRKVGRDPILIERASHPRFAIGESSTPLANLSLERLCRTYDLPALLPLCKYGTWQQSHPELACGVKRGFSFFKHHGHDAFAPQPGHANELLVAASPCDEVADTHWYREHFDAFFLHQAQELQIPYYEHIEIESIERKHGWLIQGKQDEENVEFQARFIIDATGASSVLAKALGIACDPQHLKTNSWSVYNHFRGVELWEDILVEMGGNVLNHPYPCDQAALHHIFDDGWMWGLRFNNGITSAGVVLDGDQSCRGASNAPESIWNEVLACHPSVARQFVLAEPVQPFTYSGRYSAVPDRQPVRIGRCSRMPPISSIHF